MSKRASIVRALANKLKLINGEQPYRTNLFDNSFPQLKFWDEVNDFPSVYITPGSEQREYLPSDFTWAYLNVSLKVYCKGEDAQLQLESLLEDIELVVDQNRVLVYDELGGLETTEILITSIVTDEGLLAPYAVGEVNLQVRYALV